MVPATWVPIFGIDSFPIDLRRGHGRANRDTKSHNTLSVQNRVCAVSVSTSRARGLRPHHTVPNGSRSCA